jgi:predicted nuclease with RNAse H fold
VKIVVSWLNECDRAIIALDAPLGWSAALGSALAGHQAGKPMGRSSDDLFKRATDKFIKQQIRKNPLEIGASWISRSAVAALGMLDAIQEGCKQRIPIAWGIEDIAPFAAIEVYPAATRLAYGATDKSGSLDRLERYIEISPQIPVSELSIDAIDAMVCVLAASDFVEGRAERPQDMELAKKEGWIWSKARSASV